MIGASQIMREEEQQHQGDPGKDQYEDGQKARHRVCSVPPSPNVGVIIVTLYLAPLPNELDGLPMGISNRSFDSAEHEFPDCENVNNSRYPIGP